MQFQKILLVLSCFFRVHPLGGLFLAHAEAGLHCTVQSITHPWAGCSGLVHLVLASFWYPPQPPHQKQNARKSTKNVYTIALFTLRCIHVHHLLQFC